MSIQFRGEKTENEVRFFARILVSWVFRSTWRPPFYPREQITRNRVRRRVESRAGRRGSRTLNAHDGARQRFLLALPRGAQSGRPRLQEGRRRVRAARRPRLRRARRVRGGGEAKQKGPRHSGTKRGHSRGTARANGRRERVFSSTHALTRGKRARLAPLPVASRETRGLAGRCTKTLVRLFREGVDFFLPSGEARRRWRLRTKDALNHSSRIDRD